MQLVGLLCLALVAGWGGAGRVKRVVGGRKAAPHRYPWQAYLEVVDSQGKETRCGGAVLSTRHVLTAAHCLMDPCGRPARRVHLHLGAHDICDEDWSSSHLVRKEYMVLHPLYDPT
jgi:secreted trypsin-like serine protease